MTIDEVHASLPRRLSDLGMKFYLLRVPIEIVTGLPGQVSQQDSVGLNGQVQPLEWLAK